MRQIIASQPARIMTFILFTIALSTGGIFYADDADARIVRTRDLDPNPTLEPTVGQETNIMYSIPQDAKAGLFPGTTVSKLPSGCATKYTSSLTYYDCSNVYFREYFKGNKLVYMVIEKP